MNETTETNVPAIVSASLAYRGQLWSEWMRVRARAGPLESPGMARYRENLEAALKATREIVGDSDSRRERHR